MTKSLFALALFAAGMITVPLLSNANTNEAVEATSQNSVPVTVTSVKEHQIPSQVTDVGKLHAIDYAELTFKTNGQLKNIYFADGANVKKGDVIANLENTQATAELDKAKSNLKIAQNKLNRTTDLLKKQPDALSKQDFEELEEQVRLATADLLQKQSILDDYKIVAPFSGQLSSFTLSVGSNISSSTALVNLVNLDPIEVQYSLGQEMIGKINTEQKVTISVEAYPDQEFEGQVTYVAPSVDANSGRISVFARIKNADRKLAPGMFTNITHHLDQNQSVLAVPQNSVFAKNEQRFVWVIENNKAIQKQVQLGKNMNNGMVAITNGLVADEQVVATGQQKLAQGDSVAIKNHDTEETKPQDTKLQETK